MPDGRLLTASDTGFALWDGSEASFSATFDRIARILVWQEDLVTHDHVHVEIDLGGGEALVIDEDMRGFRALMDRLAGLPGFDTDWWDKAILPPFASNTLVAYVRPEPSETS